MVYNTQNYWVFGLCPSSCILETRKYSLALCKGPNRVGVFPPPPPSSPEDGNRSIFRCVFYVVVSRIP
jgi:hypothetical protein